ncbi:MAG: DUF2894 domain-containing protein [Bradymonadia bacterium]
MASPDLATDLVARLDALKARGAEGFDGPAVRFIANLVQKATTIGGGAGDRLVDRAHVRLQALETQLDEALAKSEEALSALAAVAQGPEGEGAVATVQALVDQGDHREALRTAQRLRRTLGDGRQPQAKARVRRQLSRAEAADTSALSQPLRQRMQAALDDPTSPPETLDALADEAAKAMYRAVADDAHATLAVAQAGDEVPDEAGPYNPQAVSARALAALEALSPAHLRHWVRHLEGFESLSALPEPPAPKKRGSKRGGGRRR